MALITLNRKKFESEIGKLDDSMQNKVAMFGTPLENINNETLEIEIFPNRPDLLSYEGYKKAFLAFLGKKTGLKGYKINKPEKDYKVLIDSSVKEIRPFTACAIIKDLELDDEKIKEIIDLQEKLHITLGRKRKKLAVGIYPLEKIKLPITYKALEPDKIKFIPLESNKEMSGLEILQKHPAGKEYAKLLAGKIKFPIFTDAENKILSMPPIINSELTGKVTEKTKNVFIECSGFDLEILKKCLNIIVSTLGDMGGKIYQMELQYKNKEVTPNLAPEKMKISLENTNKLLGLDLKEKEIKNLLEKMGHNYNKGIVEIPSWRIDILHEVDLIEEIAIAYGYENFEPILPEISTIGEEDQKEVIKRKISEIIQGLRILEVSNYHLTTKKDQLMRADFSEKQEKELIELKDSKTEYNILRKDLSHYLLKNLSENVDVEYPQKIFEIGKVFENKNEIVETTNLALAVSPGNFTETKQIIEYVFKMLGIKIECKEPTTIPPHFIEGRCAEIRMDNQPLGFLGEVHPKILDGLKIRMPVAMFEIDLEKILKAFLN
ncbi:MAG: phenylalanine--tRNA ligase subunit beta [Nanoarchaeota archaeon]